MKKYILGLILSLAIVFQAAAQSLQASVNRTEVPEGETILLTLTYDGNDQSGTPDISVLQKDFTIYSQGSNYKINIINGKKTITRQWNLGLIPQKSGEIIIPAIKMAGASSQPFSIRVISGGDSSQASHVAPNEPKFSVRAEVDNHNPYVQQQINLTVSLYDRGGFQGESPVFFGGNNQDWIVKQVHEPTVSSKVIDGQSLREIKFYYALFPQKSGELTIPSVRLNGYYLTQAKGRLRDPFEDLFGNDIMSLGLGMSDIFATRNPVQLMTKPIKIQVRPAQSNGHWWLPAESVRLYSEWNPAKPNFQAGEAVSRTVYVQAIGVLDTQIPAIDFPKMDGMKQYPEKPIAETTAENGQIIALKKITNVYIPEKTGQMTLPPVVVNWFNVTNGQIEQATLPAMHISVEAGNGISTISPQNAPEPQDFTQRTKTVENVADETAEVLAQEMPAAPKRLYAMIAGAFVLGILLTYLIIGAKGAKESQAAHGDYLKSIKHNAKAHDFRGLRDNIIEWARQKYRNDKVTNLKDVAKLVRSKEFENELNKLSEELYSNNGKDWDAAAFIASFEKIYKKKSHKTTEEKILPELYK